MRAARRRGARAVLRAPLEPRHYVALVNFLRVFPRPWHVLARYLLGRGEYPFACDVRTPTGRIRVTTYSPDDVVTVVEVFARLDYAAPGDLRLAVDFGANIGVASLYFLTRNRTARCHAYEPVPVNADRFRRNLAGFEGRYVLREVAVATAGGQTEFGVEPTGRYGGIGVATGETIRVDARGVNDVLAEIVAEDGEIDVLKIDIEGLEEAVVRAIRPELLDRVRLVYLESERPLEALHADRFVRSRRGQCERLERRDDRVPAAPP